jgi:predicted small integral membrane protein
MINWLVNTFGWMYWTLPSGLFFIAIFGSIALLGVIDRNVSPNIDRKGFFPIETGRGDRLFIGILSTIAIFLIWLLLFGQNYLLIAALIAALWFFVEFKWG